MWLNQDFTCTFTHICYFYSESTIHIYPSISISRITQKYSTANPGENNQKYLSRVSVRGTLTDAHNEITRAQIEALNSTY